MNWNPRAELIAELLHMKETRTDMAKTEQTIDQHDEFSDIDLDDYTPETIEGKYDRHVRATLARDEALSEKDPEAFAGGKRSRVKILVPTGEPTVKDDVTTYPDVAKEVRLFQDSARLRDRTARKVGEQDQGDGYTALQFILIPKQSRPRLSPEERAAREAAGETVEPDESDEA